jgi:hypothetical protein
MYKGNKFTPGFFNKINNKGEGLFFDLDKDVIFKEHPIKVIGKGLFAGRDYKTDEIIW